MTAGGPSGWLTILPPLAPGDYLRRPRGPLPFPLGEPSFRLFAMARRALWHGITALGLRPGDEILVPGLHHGSEVEALVRAGATPRFYDLGEDLAPRADELEALLGPRTRALYLLHVLGVPQDGSRWRRWCDERGLLLVEDAAMAWLSTSGGRPVGSFGDLAIFCLYKTVPVPDGGAAVGVPAMPRASGRRPLGAGRMLRRHASWAAQRVRPLARHVARTYDPIYRPTDQRIVLGDVGAPAGAGTEFLLPRLADPGVAARRRENYRRLAEALGERVAPPFREIPDGASPFALPLRFDDVTGRMRHFADRGIHGTQLWPIGHPSAQAATTPHAQHLRDHTLTLPVHQGLREVDLERLVAAASAA